MHGVFVARQQPPGQLNFGSIHSSYATAKPLCTVNSISGATSVLLNFTGSSSLTLYEVNEAAQMVAEETAEDENVIFGLVVDESMGDMVKVTVIATGLGGANLAATAAIHAGAQAKVETQSQLQAQAPIQAPIEISTAPALDNIGQTVAQVQADVARTSSPIPPAPNAAMLNEMAKSPMGSGAEGGDLARARALATRLGISSLTDDDYDVPTYLRRQSDKDLNG